MIRVDLTETQIPPEMEGRVAAYLAGLTDAQLERLWRSRPAEAARLMGVDLVAPGLAGYGDDTLGWINFVIQAASAVYSANKAREKKMRAQNDMQRQVNEEIRAENTRRRAILAARAERDKFASVSDETQTGRSDGLTHGQIGAIAGGGIAILAGLVYYLTRRRRA